MAFSFGLLTKDVLTEQPLIVAAVMACCGLASFVAFQWAFSRMSGQGLSVVAALRFVMKEFGYLVLLLVAVFCIFALSLAVMELFR